MKLGCVAMRRQLGPFVDGELRGAQMLVVAQHLDDCLECSGEVRALRGVGDMLRASSRELACAMDFDGLAGNVVGRSRAESAMSWRGQLSRACEDWHWAIVGAGSIAATCISTVLVSAILAFGPVPERDDSLAALMANLTSPTPMFVSGTRVDDVDDSVYTRVDSDRRSPMDASYGDDWVRPASYRQTEAALVSELAEAVTHKGRVVTLDLMRRADRPKVEALLDNISRYRAMRPALANLPATFTVHEVRLVAAIGVTASGVGP